MACSIRTSLQTALAANKSNFHAAYSFSRSYPDAPNPALKLADLGIVGLPLSVREAEAVKSRSAQAPFGMGERTLVDKSVRDTWEMDATQVSFANPKWTEFVSQVVAEVCQTLGVNVAASRPRAELYKLLLYETGSHFLPHVDTEKADGMFATIIIVLPSYFTGGAAHLSFGDLSTVYDCSAKSQLETTVMAWYTDVTHEIKPVTSGYRLALSYNLIHTTQSLRPALSPHDSTAAKLKRVLEAWLADMSGRAPDKILYLLDHKYSEAGLRASALKGADAQKVALLDALAQQLGFRLGLATAHCHLVGSAADHGGGGGGGDWGQRRWYGDEDEDENSDDVEFLEVESREMTIEHFVDLDGELLSGELDFDRDSETIPADLADGIEAGEHDEQEYEGYMGNYAGSLERWYRRTVLVIWPARNDYSVLDDSDTGLERAIDDLCEDNEPEQEKDIVDFILAHRAQGPYDAAAALCEHALDRDDPKLWQRAVTACAESTGVHVLDDEDWQRALEEWGWDVVRPSFELMLQHDLGNKTRLDFLRGLERRPWDPHDVEDDVVQALHKEIQPWAAEKIVEVLKTLRPPTVDDCGVLLDAAHENGGMACLKDVILPQLVSFAPADVLRNLAVEVVSAEFFPASAEKSVVVANLLSTAISKRVFFRPSPVQPSYRSWNQPAQAKAPAKDPAATTKRYIQTCIELGCAGLAGDIVDKIADTSKLQETQAQECARSVMLPVVAYCAAQLRKAPDCLPKDKVAKLKRHAVKLSLDWFVANAKTVTRQDVAALLRAVLIDGDATEFMTSVVPVLTQMQFTESSLRSLIDELHAQRARFVFPEGYTGRSFNDTFAAFVDHFIHMSSPQSATQVIATLEWLHTLGSSTFWKRALDRYVTPPGTTAQYAKTMLVPLAPALRQWGIKHGVLAELGPVFQGLVKTWLRLVLGPVPPANATLAQQLAGLSKWKCTCMHCCDVRTFLTTSTEPVKTLSRIGAPSRKHVEGFLTAHARGVATFEMIRSTPQGLTIRKTDALRKLLVWKTEHANGEALLKSIAADDTELRQLLGGEYANVIAALQGTPIPQVPSTASSAEPSGPSRSTIATAGPTAARTVITTSQATAHTTIPSAVPVVPPPSGAQLRATERSAASAGPSMFPQPPAPPMEARNIASVGTTPAGAPNAPMVGAVSTTSTEGDRPAKRRKVFPTSPDEIIDLT